MKKLISFFIIALFFYSSVFLSYASLGDGIRTIKVYVKDKAGNIQTTAKTTNIVLDTISPVISITNPDISQTKQKIVKANITDLNLDTIKYLQIPNTTTCDGNLTFNNYINGSDIILSSELDNNTKMCFQAKDKANNYTYAESVKIENIDTTPPEIAVVYKNGNDEVISSTGITTSRKISAFITDTPTGSSNFGNPSLGISSILPIGKYSNSEDCYNENYMLYNNSELTFNNPILDNGKQICYKGIDPAGNITYKLVTVHLNAIPTFSSLDKRSTIINNDNKSNVYFEIKSLYDADNDSITVKYSIDGSIWTNLSTLTSTNSSRNYTFTLDTTSWPEGNNILYAKLNDGNYDSEVKQVSIFKDTISPEIHINNILNNNPEQIKYLSGLIIDSNYFSGYISIVNSTDDCTLTNYSTNYSPGQNISLNNESYNGKKVCFKAEDIYGNISYLSSNLISGIDTTPPSVPTSLKINNGEEFTNNSNLNLDIIHPNENDINEWCIVEDGDYGNCIWQKVKPNIYNLIE